MAGQLRVDEITNEAGTGSPSFPNQITPASLGTGTPSSANFLRGDGAWSTLPPSGFIGAETITTNTTLTAASKQVQVINVTQGDREITLPNATTLQMGANVFVFINNTPFSVLVKNSAGTAIGYVVGGLSEAEISLNLVDNSTAAGVWEGNLPKFSVIALANSVSFPANTRRSSDFLTRISSSTLLYIVRLDNRDIYAVAINEVTQTIGAAVLVYSSLNANGVIFYAQRVSDTQAIFIARQVTSASAVNWSARALNISGTTISAQTAATSSLNFIVDEFAKMYRRSKNTQTNLLSAQIGSTFVFPGYVANATGHAQLLAISVSGNTTTIGTPASLRTSGTNAADYAVINTSSTEGVVAYRSSTVVYARGFSVSGSSITLGGETNSTVVAAPSVFVRVGDKLVGQTTLNLFIVVSNSGTTAAINTAAISPPGSGGSISLDTNTAAIVVSSTVILFSIYRDYGTTQDFYIAKADVSSSTPTLTYITGGTSVTTYEYFLPYAVDTTTNTAIFGVLAGMTTAIRFNYGSMTILSTGDIARPTTPFVNELTGNGLQVGSVDAWVSNATNYNLTNNFTARYRPPSFIVNNEELLGSAPLTMAAMAPATSPIGITIWKLL